MSYTIRPMGEADRKGRVLVHCQAWEETYRGLIPDAVLDSMTPENIMQTTRSLPMETLVAADGEGVVGFVCFCREARAFIGRPGASEIAALYLLRSAQGLGLGRQLLEAALAQLPQGDVVLYVLDGNQRAIRFYEHMGFRPTGRRLSQKCGGGEMTEIELLKQDAV